MEDLEQVKGLLEDIVIRVTAIYYRRHNKTGGMPDLETDEIKYIAEGLACLFVRSGATSQDVLDIKNQIPSAVAIQQALEKVYGNGRG